MWATKKGKKKYGFAYASKTKNRREVLQIDQVRQLESITRPEKSLVKPERKAGEGDRAGYENFRPIELKKNEARAFCAHAGKRLRTTAARR